MKSAYAQKYEVSQCAMSHNAACVDDRRTVPVAQRVVQRESGIVQRKGEANGKFKYCDSFESHEEGFEKGKILFCPYGNVGTECKSRGFTGCLMMAFHFNKINPTTKQDQTDSLKKMMVEEYSDAMFDENKKYIAHVYMASSSSRDDTKAALFDAENRGLITIEALFKPCTPLIFDTTSGGAMDGGLSMNDKGGWSANVYAQSLEAYKKVKSIDGADKSRMVMTGANNGSVTTDNVHTCPVITYNVDELRKQTEATKAFVYASIVKNQSDRENVELAKKRLLGMSDEDLNNAALLARDEVKKYLEDLRHSRSSKCCLLM